MKPAVDRRFLVARLVLCATLFGLWMAYLLFLVITRPRTEQGAPLVLSRPQVLASEVDVIARIDTQPKGETDLTVVRVLYPDNAPVQEGDVIHVTKLDECRSVQRPGGATPSWDWSGPGEYLLPLKKAKGRPGHYEVAAVPASPGFSGESLVRIYPATAEALAQYRQIKK
jgi:hypothetical protein